MNIHEAKKYRERCLFMIGTRNNFEKFPYEVDQIVISPVGQDELSRMKIFVMTLDGFNANEKALKKYDYSEEDLFLYVLRCK